MFLYLAPYPYRAEHLFLLCSVDIVHIKIIFRQSFHLRVERRRIVVVMRCPLILHLSRDSGHSGLQRQWDTWENINKAKGSILLPCPQPPNPEVRICKDTVLEKSARLNSKQSIQYRRKYADVEI